MKPVKFFDLIEPPKGLFESVLARVEKARRHAARWEFGILAVLSCVCTLLFIPVLQYAAQEFYLSGFYDYLSLAFSDTHTALTSKEFVFSLIESLPPLAVLLTLVIGGALAYSLVRATRAARGAWGRTALA
jgi:ABC-type sulfate transport system permease component